MHAFASYIMRGYLQALSVVVIFAGLSLVIPPLGNVSGAALALMTLRGGARQGMVLMTLAVLVVGLLVLLTGGNPTVVFVMALVLWLPVWVLSTVLRATISLEKTLYVALAMGFVLVAGMFVTVPDPAQWWYGFLQNIRLLLEKAKVVSDPALLDQMFVQASRIFTGIVASALALNAVLSVVLARWFQSLLYNPGGFTKEFQGLRFGRPMALALLIPGAVAMLGDNVVTAFSTNLFVLVMMMYSLHGAAVFHYVAAEKRINKFVIAVIYFLMMFVIPQLLFVFVLLGVTDTWFDIRARMHANDSGEAQG